MRTTLKTVVLTLTAVVALAVGASFLGMPGISNPFGEDTVVRDHSAVIRSLQDLEDLHVATGDFQVVIDIEKSTRFVPSFIRGERTSFLAQGSVDAVVDLGALTAEDFLVAPDGAVTVILPLPVLADPVIDNEESSVLDRDRGVLDRLGSVFSDSPTSERQLLLEAERQIAEAAAASDLLEVGRENAIETIETLLSEAGITDVRVVFAEPDLTR